MDANAKNYENRSASGTVTFLFTDIEGSTKQLQRLGEGYASVLQTQRKLLRAAFDEFHGREVDTQGDSFFVAFARAADGIAASVMAQRALAEHDWHEGERVRVRMGMHTGAPQLTAAGYVGLDVHIAARICAAAHGGQVLLSRQTYDLAEQLQLDDISIRDLGEHRLKDLDRPRRIFQLVISNLADDFPPLRTLDALPHNLPIQLTSFVGREKEIREIRELVGRTRLLTLTGAGGAGKTRLSLHVAADLVEEYKNGVWFIELAPLSDPALVAGTVATTLGVREQSGQQILDSLIEYLRARELLLVLDNCEHLIDACARLADALLRACPNLRVLATSREPLGIAGETTWIVPSLTLPDTQQPRPTFAHLSQYEAVQLFVARAVAVQPVFKLTDLNAASVTQICQRLDGIPLAIELAAARVNVLQTAEIAARLDDRFRLLSTGSRTALPRQQTLRGAIDWSYDLLSDEERVLLRRMSVFAGGCTLEAAEQVAGDREREGWSDGENNPSTPSLALSIPPSEILDLLSRLVDKSLVIVDQQRDETRYRMLETIREYAREGLEESGEAEHIRQRHAEFLLDLAERVPPTMTSAERKARYIRFDLEQDNFRAAMTWALQTRRAEIGLRLVGALGDYWFWWANRWNEGWSWISQFLALPESTQPKHARAYALRAAVNLLHWRGELEKANQLADESLALFRELGDKAGMAWVLVDKGWNTLARDFALPRKGWNEEAEAHSTESLMLFREIGDPRGIGWALYVLAASKRRQDPFALAQAAALLEEGITAMQAAGDDAMAGQLYSSLGGLYYDSGEYARAAELVSQAVTLCRDGGDEDGAMDALGTLAVVSLARGDIEHAASQLKEYGGWCRQYQHQRRLAGMLSWLGYVHHLQGDYGGARALLRETFALQQQEKINRVLVESLEVCAFMSADLHQPQRAARLFGAAGHAREKTGWSIPPGDMPFYNRHLARARADLDKAAFDAA